MFEQIRDLHDKLKLLQSSRETKMRYLQGIIPVVVEQEAEAAVVESSEEPVVESSEEPVLVEASEEPVVESTEPVVESEPIVESSEEPVVDKETEVVPALSQEKAACASL